MFYITSLEALVGPREVSTRRVIRCVPRVTGSFDRLTTRLPLLGRSTPARLLLADKCPLLVILIGVERYQGRNTTNTAHMPSRDAHGLQECPSQLNVWEYRLGDPSVVRLHTLHIIPTSLDRANSTLLPGLICP